MSQLSILSFKHNLTSKLRPSRERQLSDLIGEPLYEPDRKEMEWVFSKIAGPDNKIKVTQLKELLTKLGVANAAEEAVHMIKHVGSKKDESIDLECFLDVHKDGVMIREIRHAFSVFDKDKDGKISARDMKRTFSMLGESIDLMDCEKMLKEVDRNQKQHVDMDDFIGMMTRPAKK
ncbi:polcalcin Jun o 2-like [Carex rostrata]